MPRRTKNFDLEKKLARLHSGEKPRILDLFSGCGGLALGFSSAGCISVGGVELDPFAAKSYALNFHSPEHGEPDSTHVQHRNILTSPPRELLDIFQPGSEKEGVDIIIGGPPCPAFTRIGRAKLREVYNHPEAYKHDPRAKLYVQYLEYVRVLRPVALLMENVPELLNWGGHNLGDEICESLEQLGYHCTYTLLNAINYCVPQTRERFFLVATHKVTGVRPSFPAPHYTINLPIGYKGTRHHALKTVLALNKTKNKWYQAILPAEAPAIPAITASEAISDLPPLESRIDDTARRGRRGLNEKVPHNIPPTTEYTHLMRTWPGFQSNGYLRDHITRRLTERDYRLFEAMEPGDDYPKAHLLAKKLFDQELRAQQSRMNPLPPNPDSYAYAKLRSAYIPPYDPGKFPNKWRKLSATEPVRTLMAHIGKDTYSHIHYDSRQRRVISVREAARLQSFPDGFVFAGSMNAAYRQIGNSVPPLMAWALADNLLLCLQAKARVPVPLPTGTPIGQLQPIASA